MGLQHSDPLMEGNGKMKVGPQKDPDCKRITGVMESLVLSSCGLNALLSTGNVLSARLIFTAARLNC